MNTQMDVSRKIMEILDDNAQQVPEGFYLEMCNQLKNLHVALPTPEELERRELAVRRARNRLERQAAELNSLKEELNKSVQEYNKCVEKFKEKKRKLDQTVDRIQVREDFLKGREQLMEDFRDNMTLTELKRTLGLY
jgi:exonuclease VII small subunit